MADRLRVGVVGVGFMGSNHARVYSELESEGLPVELVAVADVDYERARRVCARYGCRAFRDYREMIGLVDAVSIAVPTSLHARVALDFIREGVHVLVEKPLAATVEEARRIVSEAEKHRVTLMVGHIERFNPAVERLREIIGWGWLGGIVSMHAKRVGPLPPRIRDVGVTVDLAIHDVDVMTYVTGLQPRRVYAKTRSTLHPAGVDDIAVIVLEYEGDVVGVVETNWLTPYKLRRLSIVGERGVAELDYIAQELSYYNRDLEARIRVDHEEPLKRELRHFITCILEGKKPVADGHAGLQALIVVHKALESSRLGAPVPLEPA